MNRGCLFAITLVGMLAGACSGSTTDTKEDTAGDPDPSTGDSNNTGGDAGGAGDGLLPATELQPCSPLQPSSCASDLECLTIGISSICLVPCTWPAGFECDPGETCVVGPGGPVGPGYCIEASEHFEECGLMPCPEEALCTQYTPLPHSNSTRCVPVCDAGTGLPGHATVSACPNLPASLGGETTSCTAAQPSNIVASFCSVEADVAAPCDQAIFRCNEMDARPDTDAVNEAAVAGGPDPGALSCLTGRCLRVCSIDGGNTLSSCGCPASDTGCHNPTDTGLVWGCEHISGLAADLRVCVPLESCTDSTVCSDNTSSGLTECGASPYSTTTSMVCIAP